MFACVHWATLSLTGMVCLSGNFVAAFADSTVIDGPGFRVESHRGWFGTKRTVYQDALGNAVEKKTGLFGGTREQTRLFGSEAVINGKNVTVTGSDGQPLVARKQTLFHGKETRIDGNGVLESLKRLLDP